MALKKDLPRQHTEESHNPQVEMFIKNIVSDPKAVYLHIPAVNSGEMYGPNNWGDYFPEESLRKNYKTFYNAKVYRRHKNKDPRKSIGDVVLSTFNDKMKRVELVVKIYRDLAPDIAADSDAGKPVGFSMGCRVPFEQCSVCSKKMFKTADRCDHLKHHMNEMVDGKQCYSINEFPEFFDISETPNPADKMVWSISKVASESCVAEDPHVTELSEESLIDGFLACSDLYFTPREHLFKTASLDTLNKYAEAGIEQSMASSLINGFVFTPEEFQYICLAQDSEKLAESVYKEGETFEGLPQFTSTSFEVFDGIADNLIGILEKTATDETTQDARTSDLLSRNPLRSGEAVLSELLEQAGKELSNISQLSDNRLRALNAKAPKNLEKFPDVLNLLLRAGLLYGGYRLAASKIPIESVKKILNAQPTKVIGAIAGYELASKTMKGEKVASYYNIEKFASWLKHSLAGLGGSYLLSADAFRRSNQGKKVPGPLKFVAENPLISSIGLGVLSHKSGKLLSKLKGAQKGIVKKSSEIDAKLDNIDSWVECNNLRDCLSDATIVADPEIFTLADEQFRSVNELFG